MAVGYFFKAGAALEPQGGELYEQYPRMRDWCDEAAGWTSLSVPELLLMEIKTDDMAYLALLRSVVVSLGIVDILGDAQISPRAIGGYSSGVMVAACVAGGIERKDLISLISRTAEASGLPMDDRPQGVAQLAFPFGTPDAEVEWYYGDEWPDVYMAADSGLIADGTYRIVTVSGYMNDLERLATHMPKKEQVLVYPSYGALHSPLSRALRDFMEPHIRATKFRDPTLPLFAGFKPGMLTTADELADAFIRNYTDPVWLDHLRFGLRKLGVRLAIAPGPGKPLQMSVMQWPFEVVEVLTPPDIVRAMSTIHELALG